jgi:ABC-2 type transport system permease protein
MIKHLIKVWFLFSKTAAQSQFTTVWAGTLFLIGKVVRFFILFAFIFSILTSAGQLAGLTREQVIFFFLVFNLIDTATQFLFRGVYVFRPLVVKGEFDFDLLKPYPSFFRPIFGWTDIFDFIILIPLIVFVFWYLVSYQLSPDLGSLLLFLIFTVNAVAIGFSWHLIICSVGVMTTEVDHLVWMYRDVTSMARFPTDIYRQGIRWLLTFTIPVIILFTVPAKALMGILSWPWAILAFFVSGVFLWASLKFWRFALTRYSSASS